MANDTTKPKPSAAAGSNPTRNGGNNLKDAPKTRLDKALIWITGIFLFLLPFVLFAGLVGFWPISTLTDQQGNANGLVDTLFHKGVHIDLVLIVIVLISGALGSVVFTARSFALHLAHHNFGMSWLWWYAMRVPVGMGLALILYIVLRGGLLTGSVSDAQTTSKTVNPYGFAGIAMLAGMFARQVSEKLSDVFETVFNTDADKATGKAAIPIIKSITPTSIAVGTKDEAALTITVHGASFGESAKVMVGDDARAAKVLGKDTITFALTPKDVEKEGTLDIRISNPGDSGGTSETVQISVVNGSS